MSDEAPFMQGDEFPLLHLPVGGLVSMYSPRAVSPSAEEVVKVGEDWELHESASKTGGNGVRR